MTRCMPECVTRGCQCYTSKTYYHNESPFCFLPVFLRIFSFSLLLTGNQRQSLTHTSRFSNDTKLTALHHLCRYGRPCVFPELCCARDQRISWENRPRIVSPFCACCFCVHRVLTCVYLCACVCVRVYRVFRYDRSVKRLPWILVGENKRNRDETSEASSFRGSIHDRSFPQSSRILDQPGIISFYLTIFLSSRDLQSSTNWEKKIKREIIFPFK